MKIRKALVSLALSCTLAFVLLAAVSAYTLVYRGSVSLAANQNSVTSSAYAGKYGRGNLTNHAQSAGDARLYLDETTGGSWYNLTSIVVAPGKSGQTNIWGNTGDRLFRISVHSTNKPIFGNPGRIAYGYIYTGY